MSILTLASLKLSLPLTHSMDDADLQRLLDGAEAEACRFLNRSGLPTLPYSLPEPGDVETVPTDSTVAADVRDAVFLLVRSRYDENDGDQIAKYRSAAETMLQPYRTMIGV